jgi:type IV pilus assembly protein PilX
VKRHGGTALPVCLLMLVMALMLGLSAARIALQGERAARNDRDRKIAFHAAEAALLDAQQDIEQPATDAGRGALFAAVGAPDFPAGCGAGTSSPALGLCAGLAADPAWLNVDFMEEGGASARTVPYGLFTGQAMQVGAGTLPTRLPRYLIEAFADRRAGASADLTGRGRLYRISAVGFGAQAGTRVMLQAWYRRTGAR